MKKLSKNLFLSGLFCLSAISCSSGSDHILDNDDDDSDDTEKIVTPAEDETLVTNSQDLSSLSNTVFVAFSNSGEATVTNNLSDASTVTASVSGNYVNITSTASAGVNYVLSGETDAGQFYITSDNKFNLYLNGVGITNPKGAAIYSVQKAVTLNIYSGTTNRLIDGTSSEDNAAFFSKGKIEVNGTGTLQVRGKVKHAINSKNEITINEGTITVREAASDAIHADGITINGGTITAYAVGEGLDGDDGNDITINGGTLALYTTGQKGHGIKTSTDEDTAVSGNIYIYGGNITVQTDGIASKAINSDGNITLTAGTLNLTTTGSAYYDTDDRDVSSSACVKSDGNIVIEDGMNITAKSTGKGGKGINAGGTLVITGATINVTTTGDQYVYNSSNDTAAKAIKATGNLTINSGTINVETSKTEAEGIESKATLTINDGTIVVKAYDDAINASNHIQINGGKVYAYSTSNDGIDSNGTLTVTGGVVIASGTTSPEEGFDCDNNTFTITGGVLIGTGGATSSPTTSTSTQYSLIWGGTGSSGTLINIASSDGTSLMTYKVPRSYGSSMVLLFSSPEIKSGGSYTLKTGGSISGASEFNGYYTGGTYSGGSSSTTFTVSSKVTTGGNYSSGNGGGGGGGRP